MNHDIALANGSAVAFELVPCLAPSEFGAHVTSKVAAGARLVALCGWPETDGLRVIAVTARPEQGLLQLTSTLAEAALPSLTPNCPQAHLFERELAETWRLNPVGHPWLKPVRHEAPRRPGTDLWPDHGAPVVAGVGSFFTVAGEEVHEVAVGPVHAGVIEPGHFRFQCHGETVHHLEIALGYQHRGIERRLAGGPHVRSAHYVETMAGDTSIGHALAYAHLIEALAGTRVPARAQVLRGIALELERLANHAGDLGALAGDVAYLPTMAYCGRLRGEFLNLTAALCGNRFGRGLVRPGGVVIDAEGLSGPELADLLRQAQQEAAAAVDLLWASPSVMARFEGTGALTRAVAEEIGLVGVAARACGLRRDVRHDHPTGIYRLAQIPLAAWDGGDVLARARVRWLEMERSAAFAVEQLCSLPAGPTLAAVDRLAPDHVAVSLVEGWRGEICHLACTDAGGRLAHYKVIDPSFHNWFGLALALRQQQISDFPLCNKSFNLSYCGHDL